jgi:hypothetical protein
LFRVIPSKKNIAIPALESLPPLPFTPPDHIQTPTGPAALFLDFSIRKKSLVKPFSLNFPQNLARQGL